MHIHLEIIPCGAPQPSTFFCADSNSDRNFLRRRGSCPSAQSAAAISRAPPERRVRGVHPGLPPCARGAASPHASAPPPPPLVLMPLGRGTSRCVVRPVRLPSCDLVARFRALTAARSARLSGKRTRGRCRVLGSVPGSVRRQRCSQPSPSAMKSAVRLCSGVPTPRRLVPDLLTHQGCEWRFTAARPPGSCDGRSRQLLCGACGVWPSRVPLPVGF